MEDLIKAFREENGALNRKAKELRAQSKDDEAVFCTVRANVYDICATVLRVHLDRGDPSAAGAVFSRFREEWGAALEDAKRQDDARKICIGEAKLEVLADVCARLSRAGCA